MKRALLTIVLICFVSFYGLSQIDCKKTLESIKTEIKKDSTSIIDLDKSFKELKEQINTSSVSDSIVKILKETSKKIVESKKKRNQNIDKFNNLLNVCLSNQAFNDEDALAIQKDVNLEKYDESGITETNTEDENNTEKQTYIYFNKDQIIKEDIIKNDGVTGRILNSIISQTNQESYLGDITIPKDGEEFQFYKRMSRREWKEKNEAEEATDSPGGSANTTVRVLGKSLENIIEPKIEEDEYDEEETEEFGEIRFQKLKDEKYKYKFKGIAIQIKDGNFYDIRVKVEYNNQIYLFENLISVSFFRYNRMARINYLMYAQKQPYGIEDDISEIENFRIRLSDVLYYEYKVGNNYIPNDLILELPNKDVDGNQTNLESPTVYQIKEDTYLDKIIELRAYTDAFAVFGDANNGLLQFEGSAKLYLFPYSRQFIGTTQFEMLKSLTPYVNYARFEDDNRLAEAMSGNFNQDLDIIEKRYLTMGVNLNLFEVYHKKYPFKATLYYTADYNITEARNDDLDPENIKSLGYGAGLNITSKRFNNFGFSYSAEFKWFDFKNFNVTENFNTEIVVPVFKNEAEVYYHPTDNPNQAIFVRLRTFNYKGNSNNEAFYQFQFGYRFSLGSRSVKKQLKD